LLLLLLVVVVVVVVVVVTSSLKVKDLERPSRHVTSLAGGALLLAALSSLR
jgi:hypothetical protein